jgi:hypothetical protein
MGKTRQQQPGSRSNSSIISLARLRGPVKPPAKNKKQSEMSAEQAEEHWQQLAKQVYTDQHRYQAAVQASGADQGRITPAANNYSAAHINGYFYWHHQGLVFCAPMFDNDDVDIGNMAICGDIDGAELDLYALDCQLAAALCRRVNDQRGAAMYKAMATGYYQQAVEQNCQYWPDDNDRPIIPEIV